MADINSISVNNVIADINKINLNGTEYNIGGTNINSISFQLVATNKKLLNSNSSGTAAAQWTSDRNGCVIISKGCYVSGKYFTQKSYSIKVNSTSYTDKSTRLCVGNDYTNRTIVIPVKIGDVVYASINGSVSNASGSIIVNIFASVIS